MVRTLLATTAIAAIMSTAALAQSAPANTTTNSTTAMSPATNDAGKGAMPSANQGAATTGQTAANISYVDKLQNGQHLASRLDGATLYATNAPDSEEAGEIQNLVMAADGTIVAAVVDTGKFLGDQSKTLAIPFQQIEWTMDGDTPRAILKASRDDLAKAPEFVTREAANNAAAPGATATTGMGGTMGTMGANSANMAANSTATGTMSPNATGGNMAPSGTSMDSSNMANNTTPAASAGAANGMNANAMSGEYLAQLGTDQFLAKNVIGEDVYNSADTSGDDIGEINDLVVASSGKVDAVLVGVGGFLGIGEKNVGVPFDSISLSRGENNEPHAMLAASRDELKNAPAFERDNNAMAANTTGAMTNAANTTGTMASNAAGTMAATGAAMGTGAMTNNAANTDTTATASTSNVGSGSEAMTPVTGAELSADNLMGTRVYGPDNTTIGSIGDIALTPDGKVDAVIVDVGGFLGIGAKPVAVAMDNLQFMRDARGSLTLTTGFTQDQLRQAPEYNRDTYAENRDQMRVNSPSDISAGNTKAAN